VLYGAGFGVLTLLTGIILLPIVLLSIGAGTYGVWLFLVSVASYLNNADLGVGTAIIHFGSRLRGGDSQHSMSRLASAALVWTALIGVVIVPAFALVSLAYVDGVASAVGLSTPEVTQVVVIGSVAMCTLILRPYSAILLGSGQFILERKIQMTGQLVRIAGTLFACLLVPSLTSVATAETIALLVPGMLCMIAVYRKRLARLQINRDVGKTLREMTSFSIRSLSVSLTGAVILQGGTVIVGLVGGPSQVAYYNAAFRVYAGVRYLNSWMVAPFQSALSRVFAGSHEAGQRLLRSITFGSFGAVALACGLLIPASPFLVQVWLGNSVPVGEIALTISILLFGLVLNSIHLPLFMASDAVGRPGVFLPVQLLWAASFVVLGFALGARFGIVGVALALSLPLLVVEPLYIWLSLSPKFLGMTMKSWWTGCFAPVLFVVGPAALLAVACSFALSWESSGIVGLLPAVTFGVSSVALAYIAIRRRTLPLSELRESLRAEF
jgi:O-antigen/teichoic acid export membrane protein